MKECELVNVYKNRKVEIPLGFFSFLEDLFTNFSWELNIFWNNKNTFYLLIQKDEMTFYL